MSKLGQRLLFAIAACFPELDAYLRDITQAYVQALSELERMIYLKPLAEMNLEDDDIILCVKPLYGIPESGLHWFVPYHGHHVISLQMNSTKVDPCLLFSRNDDQIEGMTILQVDDSIGLGTTEFLRRESETTKLFKSKPQLILSKENEAVFNGSQVRRNEDGTYKLHQTEKLQALQLVKTNEEYSSTRAAIQCIGTCTRPDIFSAAQLLARQ